MKRSIHGHSRNMKIILTILIVSVCSIIIESIAIIPWWSYLIIVFVIGVCLPLNRWRVPSFLSGFTSGFLIWTMSTVFFEIYFKGEIMSTTAEIFGLPYIILLFSIGIIGGLLSGLALYSGTILRNGKKKREIS